jgi:hypothetical protein
MSTSISLNELQSSLAGVIPNEPVILEGEWRSSRRLTYKDEAQLGSGSGPFIEVEDWRWTGTLSSAIPIVCIVFAKTPESLFWAKSGSPISNLEVDLAVRAEGRSDRAKFTASVGEACLPSFMFSGDASHSIEVKTGDYTTGQLVPLARYDDIEIIGYVIPSGLIKVGRKRIWVLRSEFSDSLPPVFRDLLTHGRTGQVQIQA